MGMRTPWRSSVVMILACGIAGCKTTVRVAAQPAKTEAAAAPASETKSEPKAEAKPEAKPAAAKPMASAVGTLLHMEVKIAAETIVQDPASAPVNANAYGDYMAMMAALSKRMQNFEYSAMLGDLDRYEKQKVTVPPNTDLKELL